LEGGETNEYTYLIQVYSLVSLGFSLDEINKFNRKAAETFLTCRLFEKEQEAKLMQKMMG